MVEWSKQYRAAYAIGCQMGSINTIVTGHSLGGGLASLASLSSGKDAFTFNAAGLTTPSINQFILPNTSPSISAYIVYNTDDQGGVHYEILDTIQRLGGVVPGMPDPLGISAYGTRKEIDAGIASVGLLQKHTLYLRALLLDLRNEE